MILSRMERSFESASEVETKKEKETHTRRNKNNWTALRNLGVVSPTGSGACCIFLFIVWAEG